MKKRMKRILAVMLVSALAVSTGNVVQAADVQEPEAKVQEIVEEVGVSEEVKETAEIPAAKAMDAQIAKDVSDDGGIQGIADTTDISEELKATAGSSDRIQVGIVDDVYYNGPRGGVFSYTPDDTISGGRCGISSRFEVPGKGILNFGIGMMYGPGEMKDGINPGQITFGVFADENLTQPIDCSTVPWADMEEVTDYLDSHYFDIPSAGTYYVGLYSDASSVAASQFKKVEVGLICLFYDASDRIVSNGKANVVGQKDDQTNYFEFKAEETGSLSVWRRNAAHKCTVTLCDSVKKPLSGTIDLEKAPVYGVTKGKTYYIRIDAKKSTGNPYYGFQVDNSAVSEKSGSSKAKAATISDKSYKEGTIEAGSGQEDWYKFKLTKKKKVTIKMSSSSNDALKITVYRGNKKISSKIACNSHAKTIITSSGKWSKGTYYIRMQRVNKNSSGVYHLRVR